jgi:regulator of cell morphogenesis and NO signaling
MSNATLQRTIGDLVVERPARARVFEKFGIDYCCGGKKPLAEVCNKKGLDPKKVMDELLAADTQPDAPDYDHWSLASLTELCGHIESTHHGYLKRELPRLQFIVHKVASVHGSGDSRLAKVAEIFDGLKSEMEQHMAKEERVLFPLCRQLEHGDAPSPRGFINMPIRKMMEEHQDAGDALAEMRRLTDDYAVPPEACNTYRAMLDSLAYLEKDMHQHVHKENNILFPRAIELEAAR